MDLYLTKALNWKKFRYSLFLKIYNVFDTLNELDVYSDTGRATYSTEPLYAGGDRPRGLNTLEEYYVRPEFYSSPRRVSIGLEIGL